MLPTEGTVIAISIGHRNHIIYFIYLVGVENLASSNVDITERQNIDVNITTSKVEYYKTLVEANN